MNNIVTKQEVEMLLSGDVTIKKQTEIINKIDTRFSEIVKMIKLNNEWFDYGNCDYDSQDSNGSFDPVGYKDVIYVGGYVNLKEPFHSHLYNEPGFPTWFLWDDNLEQTIENMIDSYNHEKEIKKIEQKNKRIKRKAKLAELQESIRSKLTKEELKAITFKR